MYQFVIIRGRIFLCRIAEVTLRRLLYVGLAVIPTDEVSRLCGGHHGSSRAAGRPAERQDRRGYQVDEE